MGQSLSQEKRNWIRNSSADYQAIWDLLPSLLLGKDGVMVATVAYSWLMESYEKDGVTASNMWRILKNQDLHGPMNGAIPCGKPPFHERAPGTTWSVAKVFEEGDRDGEESEEYLTEGTSVRGLTGTDGSEESMYYCALRLFVAELDAKFMLKGDKEKKDLLTSRVRLAGEDGLSFMKACQRRESMVHSGREDVTKDMIRQHIEECVENLRIKIYRTTDNLMNANSQWWLSWRQDITRRIKKHALVKASAGGAGDHVPEEKKKQPATPEKTKREAAAGERQTDYKKAPPPAGTLPKGFQKGAEIYCQFCYGGRQHANCPADCWTGSCTAAVPKDFHTSRLNSKKSYEAQNIPDPEKEALVNDFTGKAKVAESRAVNLAEERSVMEAHLSNSGGSTTGSVSGSVHTQAFSDDECDLECQTRSFAAERRVYTIQDTCEHLPASRQCLSAEVIGVEAFRGGPVAKSDAKVCLEGVDCVAAAADIMGLDAKACAEGVGHHAAVAVALGNNQTMQSFPVKTPAGRV
ncbi:hypothetical protein CYMTET_16389 [Cymbomonas tetramitiformis]|uniref:Uncharacterized protein n=1 Tax=Cymbomonas tetramitiformis TaxID=36881 RepID=A0AAE0GCC1_9CHLO|nr:hypothetical protein CYMTET_16389 [Cymbomonas tetramitiformis]